MEFTITPDVAAQLPVGWPVGFPVLPSPAVKKTTVPVCPRTGTSLLTFVQSASCQSADLEGSSGHTLFYVEIRSVLFTLHFNIKRCYAIYRLPADGGRITCSSYLDTGCRRTGIIKNFFWLASNSYYPAPIVRAGRKMMVRNSLEETQPPQIKQKMVRKNAVSWLLTLLA